MIKRKRKINKQELINVRLYTVTGNTRYGHNFLKGEVVRRCTPPIAEFANDNDYYQSVTTGMKQYVSSTDII